MPRRPLLWPIIILLVAYTSSAGVGQQQTQERVEPEEYGVYSALIDDLTRNVAPSLVMIQDHTYPQVKPRLVQKELVPIEILEDFQSKNQQAYSLDRHFELAHKYQLLSEAEYSDISQGSPIITLSRVGFNNPRDFALVHFAFSKGATANSYVLLKKVGGRWIVQRKLAIIMDQSW